MQRTHQFQMLHSQRLSEDLFGHKFIYFINLRKLILVQIVNN